MCIYKYIYIYVYIYIHIYIYIDTYTYICQSTSEALPQDQGLLSTRAKPRDDPVRL